MSQTILVGILNDMADDAPAPGDVIDWLELEIEALRSAGRLDAQVSFVHAYGLGLPSGTAEAIENAYKQLVEQDVVMIVGPAIGDNALVATPLAERHRVPTINWAGAERARGKYMFHLQGGSHEEESLVIARHMADIGATRLGVIHDISPTGTRHLRHLQDEAAILGIEVPVAVGVSPLSDDVEEEIAKVLANDLDGLVYLGLGLAAPATARAVQSRKWEGPRIMNTAGLRGYSDDFARICDGWTYIDMHSDGNRTLRALCERMGLPRQQALAAAKGHDLGRLVAEGLARARSFDREGVRAGLEQIKWLPAAEGEDGTLLGFGIQDRGALHGRYLVLRQWRGGESVEVREG
ncbi:ABC transporter substrate-binding protein [Novosphingobium aquimarinum]|uniref:ABC transporter substrate-binding protein n=1 Tax=Novosphingobium aquimarinum TaxID=2682494 RepID=UPI0012EC2EAD|nr:ABC transporter substrate-binding protein [Novosphingobium aquimarinum]